MLSFKLVLLSIIGLALAQAQEDTPIITLTAPSASATGTTGTTGVDWGIDWSAYPHPTYYPSPDSAKKDSTAAPSPTPTPIAPTQAQDDEIFILRRAPLPQKRFKNIRARSSR